MYTCWWKCSLIFSLCILQAVDLANREKAVGLPPSWSVSPSNSHPPPPHQQYPAFTCPECNKSYSSKNSLKRHMDIHKGHFAYRCEQCNKGFQNRGPFRAHLATVHNMEEMKVSCPVCQAKFTRSDNMKAHMQMVHGPLTVGNAHGWHEHTLAHIWPHNLLDGSG